ncbi:hypothetical protein MUK42_33903 [Musa troglodytarum]|uniref:Uncharacterized protein n=1 Tax=Musa troglodytarum TaxID=320322 RepID=A0A9E7FD31_9LILI|nr:hypothetical protein MUK42_33903 [Musa troglodytarum]
MSCCGYIVSVMFRHLNFVIRCFGLIKSPCRLSICFYRRTTLHR